MEMQSVICNESEQEVSPFNGERAIHRIENVAYLSIWNVHQGSGAVLNVRWERQMRKFERTILLRDATELVACRWLLEKVSICAYL